MHKKCPTVYMAVRRAVPLYTAIAIAVADIIPHLADLTGST